MTRTTNEPGPCHLLRVVAHRRRCRWLPAHKEEVMATITLPSPTWTPDEELEDDEIEYEDPPAVPTTHPYED